MRELTASVKARLRRIVPALRMPVFVADGELANLVLYEEPDGLPARTLDLSRHTGDDADVFVGLLIEEVAALGLQSAERKQELRSRVINATIEVMVPESMENNPDLGTWIRFPNAAPDRLRKPPKLVLDTEKQISNEDMILWTREPRTDPSPIVRTPWPPRPAPPRAATSGLQHDGSLFSLAHLPHDEPFGHMIELSMAMMDARLPKEPEAPAPFEFVHPHHPASASHLDSPALSPAASPGAPSPSLSPTASPAATAAASSSSSAAAAAAAAAAATPAWSPATPLFGGEIEWKQLVQRCGSVGAALRAPPPPGSYLAGMARRLGAGLRRPNQPIPVLTRLTRAHGAHWSELLAQERDAGQVPESKLSNAHTPRQGQALLQRIAGVQAARSVGPPPSTHFATLLQQGREWALLKAKEKDSTVSLTDLIDEYKAHYQARARFEMLRLGPEYDFRSSYAPRDHALVQCAGHKMKRSVVRISQLIESPMPSVLRANALLEVAEELAAEDKGKYDPIVAALTPGSTDIQAEDAMAIVLICPDFLARVHAHGLEQEYAALEALGMAWLACDMEGLEQDERTRRVELIQALLVHNIFGDQLFLPHKGGADREGRGQPLGIRAEHTQGLQTSNLLALVANSAARTWFRENYPKDFKFMRDKWFNQRDIENYFSELNAQLGFKAGQRIMERRAGQLEWSQQTQYQADLGFRPKRRGVTKYRQAHDNAEKLAKWLRASVMGARDPGFRAYYKSVHARAAADMRAKQRTKPIRTFFK